MERSNSNAEQNIQIFMDELGNKLEYEIDTENCDMIVSNESADDYEILTDNDLTNDVDTDPDEIFDRAVHETKKRRERSFSFDHGFDFPSAVRKGIVLKKPLRKKINRGKENRMTKHAVKPTAKHASKLTAKHDAKRSKPLHEGV